MFSGFNIIEKSGAPAKKRFSDPHAVRAVYEYLRQADAEDSVRRAKIMKVYNGYLPYQAESLKQSGFKHITNVNFMGLRTLIENRADVLMRLGSDTANLVELRPIAREQAGPDAERIGRVIAEEFSTVLREGGKFIPAMATMNRQADLYGLGPVTWPTALDYVPIALDRSQLLFVPDGPVHSDEHELFMYESVLPASYIFSILDNPQLAEHDGWNLSEVKRWAVDVFLHGVETAKDMNSDPGTPIIETAISMIRRESFQEEHQFEQMRVIHVFVKEMAMPRGITHLILPSEGESKFLYEKQNAYRRMDECMIWLPYSVGDRYAKEVRGIASYMYPIEILSNRLKCAYMDSAFQSMTTMFTQVSAASGQAITLNEQGPFTVIPKELTPIQSNVRPGLQEGMNAIQYLTQVGMASVAGTDMTILEQVGPHAFEHPSGNLTRSEMEIRQQTRTNKEAALFSQRAIVMDKIVRCTYNRFLSLIQAIQMDPMLAVDYPEVMDFLERCSKRLVTVEHIMATAATHAVVTCRDLVLGSEGKYNVLTEVLSNFGSMVDEDGRRTIARDAISLRLGLTSADRYAPEASRDAAPNDQASFATMENNQIRQGQPVMVGTDQWHWSHISIHTQVIQEIVQQVGATEDNAGPAASQAMAGNSSANPNANGMMLENPRQLLQILVAASRHIQEHLAIGGAQIGMEGRAKQVAEMLRGLRPTLKALNLAIATQERQEQAERERAEREQQELMRRADEAELRKAQYEVDKKAEMEKYRIDQEHQVAMYKADRESAQRNFRDEMAARTASDKANADMIRRAAETEAKMDMNRVAQAARAAGQRQQQMSSALGNRPNPTPEEVVASGPGTAGDVPDEFSYPADALL